MSIHYVHNRYAGNKGDLWKHFVLNQSIKAVCKTLDDKINILDSHGGAGYYSLKDGHEWRRGLGEIKTNHKHFSDFYENPWFNSIWTEFTQSKSYSGSWPQIKRQCPRSSVSICEHNADILDIAKKHSNEHSLNINFLAQDSFKTIEQGALDFDFIFIDPAYSLKDGLGDDWKQLENVFPRKESFALAWYPLYGPQKPNELVKKTNCPSLEIHWPTTRKSPYVPKGCGLLFSLALYNVLESQLSELEKFAELLGGKLMYRTPSDLIDYHYFGDVGSFNAML